MNHPTHIIPTPSVEFQTLTLLHPRMHLSATEKRNYENLHKGCIGEMKFYDRIHNKLTEEQILLSGLLLESNQAEFQIDSMLIVADTIFLFEVKNYAGDFYIDGDNWYAVDSRKEIRNPLLQIQRTEFLFKQLLEKLDVQIKVESFIVFVNDTFTLYQAPLNLRAIFLSQLDRFIRRVNANYRKPSIRDKNVAEKLILMHKTESANARKPTYDYAQLRKGMTCEKCREFLTLLSKFKLICTSCQTIEGMEQALIRALHEFKLLFPDKKITTNRIYEWCNIIPSKKTVRRILMNNLKRVGTNRHSYYTFHSE